MFAVLLLNLLFSLSRNLIMVLFLAGVVSGYLTGDPHTSGKELQEGKSVQDMKHYECIHDQPMRFGHSESFDEKVHQRNIHQDPVTASPSKKTDSSRPVHNWIHYYYNHPLISGGIGDFEAIFGPKKSSKYRPGNTINSMDLDNMKAKNSNPSLTSETASYPIFFTQSKKPSSDATSSETSKTEGIFHPVLISRPVLVAPPMPIMMPENQYIYYNDKGPVLLREKEPLLDQIERDEPELILPFKNQRKEQLKQQQRITTKYPDEDDNSEHYPYGFDKYSIPNEPDEDYDDEEQTDTYSEDENDAMESTQEEYDAKGLAGADEPKDNGKQSVENKEITGETKSIASRIKGLLKSLSFRRQHNYID